MPKRGRGLYRAVIVVAVAAGCGKQPKPQQTTAGAQPRASTVDWPSYNGSLTSARFSTVPDLTPQTAPMLRRVCTYDTGKEVSAQSGPLALAGTLYFTDEDTTYAIDGTTCKERWKHVQKVEPKGMLRANRGAAHLDGRLFRSYADGHLVAIDMVTGKTVWDIVLADPKKGETLPMAPIAHGGLIYIGNAGGDNFAVTGRVYGVRASDGSVVWRFDTIPDTPEVKASWPQASAKNPPTGGALWTSFSLDPEEGILYVPTGNAAPDFVVDLRRGKSLYTNALLALDARTGKMLAYVQPLGADEHDHDVAAAPALITTHAGRRLALTAAKDGRLYAIEPRKLRNSEPELAVRYHVDTTTRANLETKLNANQPVRFCPGTQGGSEWNGPAYSPDLNMGYVGAVDWCTTVQITPPDKLLETGKVGGPWSGANDPENAFGNMDPKANWSGWLTAFDADTGEVRWKHQTPAPLLAGVTVTEGGLVLTGDLEGTIRAFDARSGKVVWEDRAGNAMGGGVMTYAVGGRPYVAAVTGKPSPIWPVDTPQNTMIVVYSTATNIAATAKR